MGLLKAKFREGETAGYVDVLGDRWLMKIEKSFMNISLKRLTFERYYQGRLFPLNTLLNTLNNHMAPESSLHSLSNEENEKKFRRYNPYAQNMRKVDER